MSRETAPGSAGPRVSDEPRKTSLPREREYPPYAGAVLRSYLFHRMEVVRRLAMMAVRGEDARAALASLRAQNERLREALETYGYHLSACKHDWDLGKHPCTCGLDAALESTDTGESRDG